MLASDVMELVDTIVSDYSTLNLLSLLERVQSLLATRQTTPSAQFSAAAQQILSDANEALKSNRFQILPASLKRYFDNTQYKNVAPPKIASFILSSLSNVAINSSNSGEVAFVLQAAKEMWNLANQYLSFMKQLGTEIYETYPDFIVFQLEIPRQAFSNNDLGEAAKILSEFDDLFADLAELSTGSADKPLLVSVATSSLIATLQAAAATGISILEYWNVIIGHAIKLTEFAKTIATFRTFGGSTEIASICQSFEKQAEVSLHKEIEAIADKFGAAREAGRRNELTTSLKKKASSSVNYAKKGVTLTMTKKTEVIATITSTPVFNANAEKVATLLEAQEKMQMKLSELLDAPRAVAIIEDKSAQS